MAKVIRRHLATPLESELPVRDRRPCKYEAYVPDTPSDSSIGLDAPVVAADVADASASEAIGGLAPTRKPRSTPRRRLPLNAAEFTFEGCACLPLYGYRS